MICIGPCCIPVSALAPLLLLLLRPVLKLLRMTPLAKYLPGPAKSNTDASKGGCCSDASCTDGVPGGVETVESLQHWEELKRSTPLLIVDFTAGWCKPCAKMGPIFADIAAKNGDAARFAKVDIDDVPEAFDGMSIPAFHVIRGGTKVDSVTGAAEDKLQKMIAKHCKKSN
eukprot:g3596.t1